MMKEAGDEDDYDSDDYDEDDLAAAFGLHQADLGSLLMGELLAAERRHGGGGASRSMAGTAYFFLPLLFTNNDFTNKEVPKNLASRLASRRLHNERGVLSSTRRANLHMIALLARVVRVPATVTARKATTESQLQLLLLLLQLQPKVHHLQVHRILKVR